MPVLFPNTADQLDMSKIPVGSYQAEVTSVTPGKSAAGNDKIVVMVNVLVEGKPRPRQSHLVISGAGSGGFDNLLRACGFDGIADQFKRGEQVPFDTDTLIGQKVVVSIVEQEYNNEMRDQINKFLKP